MSSTEFRAEGSDGYSLQHAGGFDHYVSLGSNCEVGFQIKRALGRAESGFFAWNITEPDALISLLDSDFSGLLHDENLFVHVGGHLIRDVCHNYMVHHEFDPVAFRSSPDFKEKLVCLQQKFTHLVHKFRSNAAAPGKTAYFYKSALYDARGFAVTVHSLLKRYHVVSAFELIVIQEAKYFEPDWGMPGIHNRYLKRFAPYDDTPDAHVPTWDAIFNEFPHRKPLHLVNY